MAGARANVHDDIIERRQESVYSVPQIALRASEKPQFERSGKMREICKAKASECNNDKTSMGEK